MALRTVMRETPSILGEIAFRRQGVVRRDTRFSMAPRSARCSC